MEHITQKYGSTQDQVQRNQEAIAARGEQLGFHFDMNKRAASTTPSMRIACCIGRKSRVAASRRP